MEIPRHWRLQKIRYGLIGDFCSVCHKPTFPPRDICSNCNIQDLNLKGKNGTVYESDNKTTSSILKQVGKVQD